MSPNLVNKLKEVRQNSCHHQHQLSAIILRKGIPLSFGFNQLKTNPKSFHKYKSTHAEFSACMKVKNKSLLRGATMLIYRENAEGALAMARPCDSCLTMIKLYKFKTIIYSSPDGSFVKEFL